MLCRNQVKPPILFGDVGRIDRTREQLVDALLMNFAALVLRPCRLRFQEALYFGDGLEAA